jgi:hypothetical protein
MRRALASILLVLFSFTLIAPLLLADNASDLPACCRRDGKHHCAMMGMSGAEEIPASAALKAVESKCPLFPKAGAVPVSSKTILNNLAARAGVPHLSGFAAARPVDHQPYFASRGSIQKRGPPASLDHINQIS